MKDNIYFCILVCKTHETLVSCQTKTEPGTIVEDTHSNIDIDATCPGRTFRPAWIASTAKPILGYQEVHSQEERAVKYNYYIK
jgi:hypothetical protein